MTTASTPTLGGDIQHGHLHQRRPPAPTSVTENSPAPAHDLTALSCDDANSTGDVPTRVATINLEAGESVTCTFTNTARGSITIVKDVNPEPDTTDFSYLDNIPGCTVGPLDDDGVDTGLGGDILNTVTCTNVTPGAYSVTENSPAPTHDLTALSCDDARLDRRRADARGDDQPGGRRERHLHVHQHRPRLDHHRQGRQPRARRDRLQLHHLGQPGQAGNTFSLDDDGDPVVVGDLTTRSLQQSCPLARPTPSRGHRDRLRPDVLSCTGLSTGDTAVVGTGLVTISLDAGQTVECTYTNTKHGTITIIKNVNPEPDAPDFSVHHHGQPQPDNRHLHPR